MGNKKVEPDRARAIGLKTIAFNSEKGAVGDIYIQGFCDLLKVPLLEI